VAVANVVISLWPISIFTVKVSPFDNSLHYIPVIFYTYLAHYDKYQIT